MDLSRLKANVFPGESGGDYNALFNYSNRPGGQFEGINLTDMTVDEALQFANPSGPYGQWVKGQVGRVATPMGAYQVVGSTLRAAKEGLGLTGSERMTPETQDRIGQWIYQTQGPSAWEAWGKGGNMQPQGLLGTMSTRNAPEEPRQPFFKNPDFWDTLAIGLQGMTLNPNQALIGALQERIGARREERQTTAQRNATAAWLESQGLAQLAEGVRSGAITGAEALTMARGGGREPTALMQNYEFFLQQGMTPEQALQAVRSGTVVNVGGESSEFRKASDKALATQIGEISAEGLSAQRSLGLVNELDRVLQQAPQGFGGALVGMAGNLGLQLGEGAGAVQAAQAIINRLVPQQRQPGSGPMSDADLELFKQSLPRIINQPEGNRRIIDTLKAIAQYDIERGNIARRAQIGEITPFEALQQIQSLQNPLDWVRSMSTEGVTDQERDEAMRILLGE